MAGRKIKFSKDLEKADCGDLEKMEELYNFLMGKKIPAEIKIGKHCQPKLTPKKAFTVIWFLQEYFAVLPISIELCDNCHDLFDSDNCGMYDEKTGKNLCECCRN